MLAEYGFRPEPEYEYWLADVAFLTRERWLAIPDEDNLQGTPEITASEMLDREEICLRSGAREFWVVDPRRRQVRVSVPDGRSTMYKSGQEIPLLFGGRLPVDSIFA